MRPSLDMGNPQRPEPERQADGSAVPDNPLTKVSSTLLHIMMQKQQLQQQQSTQTLMQLQLIRMKMLATMDSNREIKSRMRHMRRHIPGGCDCCQACKPKPIKPVQT